MKINKNNSGIIFYKKRKNKNNMEKEIMEYLVVEEYKYLGIWIDEKMNWNK